MTICFFLSARFDFYDFYWVQDFIFMLYVVVSFPVFIKRYVSWLSMQIFHWFWLKKMKKKRKIGSFKDFVIRSTKISLLMHFVLIIILVFSGLKYSSFIPFEHWFSSIWFNFFQLNFPFFFCVRVSSLAAFSWTFKSMLLQFWLY